MDTTTLSARSSQQGPSWPAVAIDVQSGLMPAARQVPVPMPYARNLELLALPREDDIVRAARHVLYRNGGSDA